MNVFLVTQDGNRIPITGRSTIIGRDPACDIMVDTSSVSRRHVQLSVESGAAFITDLGSSNGTTLNGSPLTPNDRRPLRNGDKVMLATKVGFSILLEAEAAGTAILTPDVGAIVENRTVSIPASQLPQSPAVPPRPVQPMPPVQPVQPPRPVQPMPPVQPPQPVQPPRPVQPPQPVPPAGGKKKSKGFVIGIVAGAAVLLAAIVVVCILVFGKPKATREAEDLIDAIGTVTLESKDAILEARAAYDDLTEKELKKLENGDVLEEAEKKIVQCGWDDVMKKVGGEWKSITLSYYPKGKGLNFTADAAFDGKCKEGSGKSGTWKVNGGEEHWLEADKIVLDLGNRTLEMKKEGNYDILFDAKNENVYVRSDDYEKYYEEHFKIVELDDDNINDVIGCSSSWVEYESDTETTHDREIFSDIASGETVWDSIRNYVTVNKLYDKGWVLVAEEDIDFKVFVDRTDKYNGKTEKETGYLRTETLFGEFAGTAMNMNDGSYTMTMNYKNCGEASGTAVFVNKDYVDRVEYDDDTNSHTVYMTNGASFRIESIYHTKNYKEY